jgi:hypothetical protein
MDARSTSSNPMRLDVVAVLAALFCAAFVPLLGSLTLCSMPACHGGARSGQLIETGCPCPQLCAIDQPPGVHDPALSVPTIQGSSRLATTLSALAINAQPNPRNDLASRWKATTDSALESRTPLSRCNTPLLV